MKKIAIKTSLWISGFMPAVALAFDPNNPGEEPPELPTDVVSFESLINTIIKVGQWMFGILMALGVVFIIFAGLKYLMAQGNDDKISEAKKILIYAIVGMVVGVLAGGIAQVVQGFITG